MQFFSQLLTGEWRLLSCAWPMWVAVSKGFPHPLTPSSASSTTQILRRPSSKTIYGKLVAKYRNECFTSGLLPVAIPAIPGPSQAPSWPSFVVVIVVRGLFFSSSSSLLYFSLLSFWTSPERKGDRSRTVNLGIAGRFLSTLCINSSTKSFFSMKKAEAAAPALCCGQNV